MGTRIAGVRHDTAITVLCEASHKLGLKGPFVRVGPELWSTAFGLASRLPAHSTYRSTSSGRWPSTSTLSLRS